MAPKLHPQAQRLRTIIVTIPIIGATACALVAILFTTRSLTALRQTSCTTGLCMANRSGRYLRDVILSPRTRRVREWKKPGRAATHEAVDVLWLRKTETEGHV